MLHTSLLGSCGGLYGFAVRGGEVGFVLVDPVGKFGEFGEMGGAESEHEVAIDGVEGVSEIQE